MTDRLPHEKGFHVSWDQLHRDARALAWRLDGQGPADGGVTALRVMGSSLTSPSEFRTDFGVAKGT